MNETSRRILDHFQVRKTKKQKADQKQMPKISHHVFIKIKSKFINNIFIKKGQRMNKKTKARQARF